MVVVRTDVSFLLAIVFLTAIFNAPVKSLMDSIALDNLPNKADYGRMRLRTVGIRTRFEQRWRSLVQITTSDARDKGHCSRVDEGKPPRKIVSDHVHLVSFVDEYHGIQATVFGIRKLVDTDVVSFASLRSARSTKARTGHGDSGPQRKENLKTPATFKGVLPFTTLFQGDLWDVFGDDAREEDEGADKPQEGNQSQSKLGQAGVTPDPALCQAQSTN